MNDRGEAGFGLPQPEFDSTTTHEVNRLREALRVVEAEENFARAAVLIVDQVLLEPIPDLKDSAAVALYHQKMLDLQRFVNENNKNVRDLVARRSLIEERLEILRQIAPPQ